MLTKSLGSSTLLNVAKLQQIYRVTEDALIAETAVWPIPFSLICSLLLKDLSFIFIHCIGITHITFTALASQDMIFFALFQ